LIECRKTLAKGTAFLLKSGTIVTNVHVVRGCKPEELWAQSSMGTTVSFVKMLVDENRDIAILRSNEHLAGGLELGSDSPPSLETKVKTWGYPLRYQGYAPILSIGYVAGYNTSGDAQKPVKRLVVNGAFNPGNSGGPLVSDSDGRVVGIVVAKWTLFSPNIEEAIKGFRNPRASMGGTFSITLPDGTQKGITDQEVLASVIEEFYRTVQVMIGEAISVSELRAFLHEQESELRQ